MVTDQAVDHFEESDTPRPWHRQRAPNEKGVMLYETIRAYKLFRSYLDLGDNRSYRKVAEQAGKSRTYIERIASRWRWKERSTAYFAIIDEEALKAFIGERKNMARRQVLGQNIATRGLVQLQEDLQAEAGRRHLKVHELVRLLEVSARLERINRGEGDDDQVASIHVTITCRQNRATRPPGIAMALRASLNSMRSDDTLIDVCLATAIVDHAGNVELLTSVRRPQCRHLFAEPDFVLAVHKLVDDISRDEHAIFAR